MTTLNLEPVVYCRLVKVLYDSLQRNNDWFLSRQRRPNLLGLVMCYLKTFGQEIFSLLKATRNASC